jgi:co-chaperonin GroES (HSP10)
MSRFAPAEGWIVVQQEAKSEVTAGGIIKPATVVEREMDLDNEEAPTFVVVDTPDEVGEAAIGAWDKSTMFNYPLVGERVLVISKGGSVVKFNKITWFVRLDAVAGSVCNEESASDN